MVRFDLQSLGRLRRLTLAARRAGGGILARPRVRLSAGGAEVTGHRDYAPGDDYRHVDWNLCARHDELLVKQFEGEADCPTYVFLDCSRSMSLSRPSKLDVARQAALALAYVALSDLGPVSVLAFSDRIVAQFGPIGGVARIAKLARFLEKHDARREPTDLAAVAKAFVERRPRPGLAVVVSDLYDPHGYHRGLEVLWRRGYAPRVVQLHDPREIEPDVLGDTQLVDVETGAAWQGTITERHVARYRRLHAAFHDSVRSYCAAHGIPSARVPIDLPENRVLLTAIGATT
jgi:uncharacterized protein (DUF58 family)